MKQPPPPIVNHMIEAMGSAILTPLEVAQRLTGKYQPAIVKAFGDVTPGNLRDQVATTLRNRDFFENVGTASRPHLYRVRRHARANLTAPEPARSASDQDAS